MSAESEANAWLVVDHELLSRLGPRVPRGEWERVLRRTGLWELDGLGGEEGRDLAEVRQALDRWAPPPAEIARSSWSPGLTGVGMGVVALVLLFGVGTPIVFAVAGAGVAGAVVGRLMESRQVAMQAPTGPSPQAERAARALRRLLARTFVTTAGARVVENTPHRVYLELRLEEAARAERLAEARLEELRAIRARIEGANQRMGRDAEDAETARLDAAIGEQSSKLARVESVRTLVARRLAELDGELERLRAIAERRALSERVSLLTEAGAERDPVEQVVAEVEVDVAEIEASVRGLALEAGEADARLRALLEVVAATR